MSVETEKPKNLIEFLLDNPQDNCFEYVYPSERFKEAGLKFKIKLPSGKEYTTYRQNAIKIGRHSNVNIDNSLLNENLILNHVIEPNFKSSEFLKQTGCPDPVHAMYKYLKAGEIDALANIITNLAGFASDAELVSEVKNF
jgi:hypothetical protein